MWWALLEIGILLLLVVWIVWMVKPPRTEKSAIKKDKPAPKNTIKQGKSK